MYEYEEIKRVHLELTTRCNAACPQCPRNDHGGKTNANLPIVELNLCLIKRIFPIEFVRQLDHITCCGNYGDAIFAKDVLPILQRLRSQNSQLDIELHTNGSARQVGFWQILAETVDRCVFAIDGLEDTNHLYRRNTEWHTIIRNVRSFIGAGGVAIWNFIPFRHNEHQVQRAADLARELGFRKFYVKRTGRFYLHGELHQSLPILDSLGRVVGRLELPIARELRNPVAQSLDEGNGVTSGYESELAHAPIECVAERSRGIYVSAEGLVFPCCWMAQIYGHGSPSRRKAQILRLVEEYGGGLDAINAKKRSIEAIVSSEIFQMAIPAGWEPGQERLEICARQCGPYRLSAAQKTASLI
jgi:MoaA/NifB/PqqE/SkfB family radical SAM enzyme